MLDVASEYDSVVDFEAERRLLGDLVGLRLAQHPLARWVESGLPQLLIVALTMCEFAHNAVRGEVMIQARV